MKLPRRQFLHLAAGAAALPAISRIARAQAYPSRPARIVVAFPPGGANDIHARMIGQWLHELVPKAIRVAVLVNGSDRVDVSRQVGVYTGANPQGREARRPTSAGTDQVRAGNQPQDREDTWPRDPGDRARPRRRGDRMM